MDRLELSNKLVEEAKASKISDSVFHVFALRQRARGTVTLDSLYNKMVIEGYKYKREEYIPTLRRLAELGLGRLDLDSRGRVRGLVDIKITLQSIGQAACGVSGGLKETHLRKRFTKILPTPQPEPTKTHLMSLQVLIGRTPIKIEVPEDMSYEDLTKLIHKIRVS